MGGRSRTKAAPKGREPRSAAPTRREQQLEFAINNVSQGVVVFDADGTVVLCNQRYRDIYELSPDVVKPGCTVEDLLRHSNDVAPLTKRPEEITRDLREALAKGETLTRLIERRNGSVTYAISRPIPGGGWVALHQDVTDRRNAERAAQTAERAAQTAESAATLAEAAAQVAHERLLAAFDVVPEGLALFDSDDRLVLWNRRLTELYPKTTNFRVGTRFEDVIRNGLAHGQYPDARGREEEFLAERVNLHNRLRSTIEHQLDGQRWVRAEEQRTAEGGTIHVRVDITDLKNREASFRLLFEHNPVPMFVWAEESQRFLAVNDAALDHYGYSREQFLSMTILDIRPEEERQTFLTALKRGSPIYPQERVWRHRKADGSIVEIAIYSHRLTYDGQAAAMVAAIDVTERNRAEARQRETQAFLDTIIENVPVSILVKSADDMRYVLVNRAAEEFLGVSRDVILGRNAQEVMPSPSTDEIAAQDRQALSASEPVMFNEVPLGTPRRGMRVSSGRRVVVRSDGKPKYLLVVIEDVTERKAAEARIKYLAEHDALTGLPNRAAFQQQLHSMLEFAQSSGNELAILRLGVDRFKQINDVFGQAVGDAALCEVARRLESAAQQTFVARVGGDEFSLISEGPQPATAEDLAERLRAALESDFAIDGNGMSISASIGVAVFPGDGADATTLVANADAALHRAKADGRGRVRFFDAEMDQRLRDRRALQQDLRAAIARGELALYYQPQARIDRTIIGFEALVRWWHPTHGSVSPSIFIPLAEESGLIWSISAWILREACRDAARWTKPLHLAVNLSPIQFHQDDLVDLIRSILAETGLDPNRLELEITEGILIDDYERAVAVLTALKSFGVRIVLDDFGSGYSSLSYLHSFPFDKIKIDRSFIANLNANPQSSYITRAIVTLGHGLGLPILGEGVETEEQLAFLRRESCDQLQGFLVGEPQPIAQYQATTGTGEPAGGDRGPSPKTPAASDRRPDRRTTKRRAARPRKAPGRQGKKRPLA
jgi:diguanylate cyclase (GGDEF)-like protein/PAS domain S-box-containing protein